MIRGLFFGQIDIGVGAFAAGNSENNILVSLCVDITFNRESPLLVLESLLLLFVLTNLRATYDATCTDEQKAYKYLEIHAMTQHHLSYLHEHPRQDWMPC